MAESSIFNLKLEVASLQSMADELGTEAQKFSHLLAAEVSSSEQLANEVSGLKLECLKFKDDIIKLKDLKFSPQIPVMETSNMQLKFSTGINIVEGKIRELQNKACIVPHDGDTKFINLELEALLNFLMDFKLGYGLPSELTNTNGIRIKEELFICGNGLGLDLCQPESILLNMTSPACEVVNPANIIDAMKGQVFDLVRELDEAKVEKEGLTRKMNQMECYYEALIHELEENQKRLLGELQHVTNEHSTCLYTLSASRAEMETVSQAMNEQMLRFVDERNDMEAINKELEKRATTSETALRRARLNYSIAVDKLQKDLELLSSQVMSMFETNENLIKQALPSQPHLTRDLDAKDDYDAKLSMSHDQDLCLRKRSVGGDIILEDLKKSFCMQEELYRKVEQELIEMYSVNLGLDLYSKALQESLCEANDEMGTMKEKIDELVEELNLSTASQNKLMVRLQKAKDDIHTLSEFKSSSISQCSDMALQNQLLEDKLVSVSEENDVLLQKVKDMEDTMMEYRSYESKYGACLAEKSELSHSLKQEEFENEKLRNEISLLKEKLMVLEGESDELLSLKENLEGNIKFVHDKVANLLASYCKQFYPLFNSWSLDSESMGIKDAILKLEEIQNNACSKISQLMEENRNLESERVTAEVSLSTVRSEIVSMKQKFKGEIQEMETKLDSSNALVEKLQVKLESVSNKLHFSSEIEEKHAQQNKVLLADLALLEDHMQELTCKDGLFAKENNGLDAFARKLESSQLTITELIHDKKELTVCLQDKTEESIKLSCEISCLEEILRNLHEELHKEKGCKDELEGKVRDLNLELDKSTLSHLLDEQSHSLKQEEFENEKLRNEISLLKEKMTILEAKSNELISFKESNEENIWFVQDKVADLLASYSEHSCPLANTRSLDLETVGVKDAILQLEEIQQIARLKISQLMEENRNLESEKVVARSEIMTIKHKFKGEIQDIVSKLDLSNALVEKLEVELESVDNKLHLSSEIEEKHVQQNDLLLSDLALLENQMHELKCKDGHLDREIKGLDALAEEFGRSKLTITELIHDKQELAMCLENKNEELMKLSCEMSCLRENLRNLHDELNKEKDCKDDLKGKIRDLELEKSRLSRLLDQQNGFIEKLRKNDSHRASLESELLDMHEYSLDAEVKHIYVANQYEGLLEEQHSQLISSEVCLRELQKRYHDLEAMLDNGLEREAHWSEEKANLLMTLKGLKSDLEVSEAQNKLLSDSNNDIKEPSEVEQLKSMMIEAVEEINYLTVAKEELEIFVIVLKGKVDEQSNDVALLEEYKDELTRLRSQCSELSHKLSEQVKKTEEFKNLSTHLKELNDKAEKRESEVQPVVAQDSLRIAFIKEQYETKVQELKQQLSISKKHGEEMLLKLQDAIDEIENRKKSEAVNLKRNEEISVKLLALEEELQSVLVEKREKNNAYDRIKAELECALLSLECCKEEKEKLEALLVEFEVQNSQLKTELTSIKGQLEILRTCENADSTEPRQSHIIHEATPKELPQSNGNNLNVNGEHLGAQKLRSSMEHLHEELEKMKNENTVFDIDRDVGPGFQVPEREIMQLQKTNEELRSMFPLFSEMSSGGNALERVLALEIELAEAMKSKNKLSAQFQSSFLKQHSDEEAVLKSFRDINDLIKEMLELKGKHGSMEAELRDMHQRYSQISLQFAEVEGERQKLKMTLKSVRSSRNLNHSSSANLTMDQTP